MDLLREEVLAAYLRYGSVAEPLRARAYAQLAAKVFMLAGPNARLSVDRIRHSISDLVGGGIPTGAEVDEALKILEQRGMVEPSRRKWKLKRKGRGELEDQVTRRRQRLSSIIERHFPADAGRPRLAECFDSTCVTFFEAYGDRWVAAITRKTPVVGLAGPDLGSIVKNAAGKYGLKDRAEELKVGFKRFLDSSLPEDTEHLWSLGMATLASRLICAGIGADPIGTRELRDSDVLLDTNALLAIALEGSRHSAAFQALGEALKAINAKLYYVYPTREEYRQVVSRWSTDTLRVIDRYGPEVVSKSQDPWIRTAVGRYCRDRSDYQRFFEQLLDPPDGIGDQIAIGLLDEPDIASAAANAESDKALVAQIQTHWLERRHRPKPIHIARHDAALTGAARQLLKQGSRAWVLTLDLTMHDLALRWAAPTGTPLWVSLDPLLQILAVDHAGTSIDPTQFGPILARLISNEVEVAQDTYTIEDLRWLDEMHRDVAGLPIDAVEETAREIHRARHEGMRRDSDELRLRVERVYQRTTAQLISDSGEARRQVQEALDARRQSEASRDRVESVARNEVEERLRKKARSRLRARVAMCVLLGVVVAVVALLLFRWAWAGGSRLDILNAVIGLAGLIFPPVALIWRTVIPKYRAEVSEIPTTARDEVAKRSHGSG